QTRSEAAARYHLPQHFVFSFGSNKPHKNLVRLVEAWSLVQRDLRLDIGDSAPRRLQSRISNPDPPLLVIAGHQDSRYGDAQARATELGIADSVTFIDAVRDEDLPALYSACDLFVFPSLYEGFGLPPLEAMACGAPVTCSNTSSMPEVVGDAALLFDPSRPQEIAQAIGRILKEPALQADLRARSLQRAAQFSWRQCARTTLEVYRSVASKQA
ncbi:MAG TPA: glycosyltransferase family 1 protein, partial [Anaerolineae bacterium]